MYQQTAGVTDYRRNHRLNYRLNYRRPVSSAGWDMEALTVRIPGVRYF
ncbi:hypothetical protein [Enterocloster hominis (ex Hitch et al. 2024)]|uniref:Uncharacterized protein n=1 Tax=Enterocloster hominis (ex Hitch et al. 2024) TaxID=1917870 RepID=A0ABV1D011_9FIRM